ncbi:multidrug effflux MFS transporter [Marinospirillum alkaliphilum]|uniref:MFS transporter, DHA1 family, bicyclomycin/chloramphenicol resistance protein n=1 Tax=Marinospirillum alkaliphilum DSM 21637 TaxID=1122209 RepID=A0A1K1V197_9GAMM|nr:multidrug effflux MFS transporter [Marinospirillum alkaliphilum]SFX18905.1 MFS transporter, DHA1 family, bicyclomycin/chloramphenicol resistance protein [Marinospirillum alkaliphilum DSM 21637]
MKTHPPLALLIFIAMASPLALNAFVPAMPDAAQALGTDNATIQLTFTLYLLTLALGQLISGQLGDYFGRRPVLLCGFGLHVLGSLVAALAGTVEVLIVGRILQALGGSTAMALARTILLDVHGREGAAGRMGYLVMAIALAQAIAPAVGGLLNLWTGWYSIFYLSVVMGSLVWLVALKFLPETCHQRSSSIRPVAVLRSYLLVLGTARYRGYVFSTTALACAFYLFVGSAPYLVVGPLEGNSAQFGFWFLTISFSFLLGSFLATRLANHFSMDQVLLSGNLLALTGAGLLLGFYLVSGLTFASLFLPMALLVLGRGLSQPNAQTAAISSTQGAAGTASGMMGFIQLLTGSLLAQSVPWFMAMDVGWIFVGILLATLLAIATHYYGWKQPRPAI